MIEFAENIFIAESQVKFYGVPLQTRMAVVRLSEDRLLIYLPVYLADELRTELPDLGQVAYIVAPNKIHNLVVVDYMDAYPDALTFAPPGLPERRPNLDFDVILSPTPVAAWADELDLGFKCIGQC